MCTIANDCAQIAERGAKPPFESPHLDCPDFGAYQGESQNDKDQSGGSKGDMYMGKKGSICHFPRALPASIWGYCSQVLVFTSIWGSQTGV